MLGGADGGGCTKESELIDSNAGFYHLFEVYRPLNLEHARNARIYDETACLQVDQTLQAAT